MQQQTFPSKMYTSCDFSTFDEKEYFMDFHHYELFDETKEYCKTTFKFDYGKGENNYRFCLYDLNDSKISNNSTKKKYVVADEILTISEKHELAKYCFCKYHQAAEDSRYGLEPFDYFCLNHIDVDEDFCDQKVIDDSKERRKLGLLSIKPKIIQQDVDEEYSLFYILGMGFLISVGLLYHILS